MNKRLNYPNLIIFSIALFSFSPSRPIAPFRRTRSLSVSISLEIHGSVVLLQTRSHKHIPAMKRIRDGSGSQFRRTLASSRGELYGQSPVPGSGDTEEGRGEGARITSSGDVASQKLKTNDALSYLKDVKDMFYDQRETYDRLHLHPKPDLIAGTHALEIANKQTFNVMLVML
ncbi:Paired amphipathic helix protein [Raphanus sativus]|nr:Paired amphipathic helix protein [Raphanus sativus]